MYLSNSILGLYQSLDIQKKKKKSKQINEIQPL